MTRNPNFRLGNVNWVYAAAFVGLHVLAAFALVPGYFSWSGVIICIFLYCTTIWGGIGLGYHRLFAHGSFKIKTWAKYILSFLGTLTTQGGPINWSSRHRYHHKMADKLGDPHTPNEGPDWAHILWIFFYNTEEEKQIYKSRVPDLLKDRVLRTMDKFFWVSQIGLGVLLYWVGKLWGGYDLAYSWVVWGIGVRTVLGHHATFSVNSICHIWGYRNFDTPDNSTNCSWLTIVTGGESNHNNHHAEAIAAQHGGLRWYEFDATFRIIQLLSLVGLVWDIVPRYKALPPSKTIKVGI